MYSGTILSLRVVPDTYWNLEVLGRTHFTHNINGLDGPATYSRGGSFKVPVVRSTLPPSHR